MTALLEQTQAPPATAGGRRRTRYRARWAVRLGTLAAAVAAWQWVTAADVRLWVRFDRLPTPVEVWQELVRQLSQPVYYQDVAQSLVRILTGFGLAAVFGIGLGVAIGRSRLLADVLQPLFEVVRPIPAIALVPVAILLFPTNEQGIVFITFVSAFFPILVSTRHAVRALPTVWEDAIRTIGGGRWRTLASVVLPGALPGVFSGLSVGIGVSWICVISAEMISGDFGVGYRTWKAYTIVDYPGVLVGMLTIGVLGWLTSSAVERVGRRATRWLPASLKDEAR
ncbi:ABC transporter permease [Catellatospora tritici]|uniref:ABC transporter permease n=1 Tax=Catellatospora tritici TaxID=2851566 RepID=UPI001C2DD234|nr:ABC transporter permease [Catellatospora tritici]MBV1851337.1 ABC transporter permease [Catellatospora tritici]